ncbi:MAG: hypothetical protein NZM12_13420 [Steroidobacteraceae bacterium]|nr:hypothetical protein [Steroidobacteraceae bacterium]MDW8259256.1 hypothetical protein [Gammaproteobacteria bacterium]
MLGRRRLRAGELVRVRPLAQILETLSPAGDLDGLPFMPEMARYCGRTFRVFKRVHKTCDLQYGLGGLRTGPLVGLVGVRCDGSAHGGCEASCMALWRERWLERVTEGSPEPLPFVTVQPANATAFPQSWTVQNERGANGAVRYRCQVTEQAAYTRPLNPFDLRQYLEDYLSANITLADLLGGLLRTLYRWALQTKIAYRFWVKIYNSIQRARGGLEHPYVQGTLTSTPVEHLNLQVGERVRIKPFAQIVGTLDTRNKNRGLWFVPQEMGEYCGLETRVVRRVQRILNERSGELIEFKTPSVILDGVYCRGLAIPRRVFCPRASALFWREIWLERVDSKEKN